MWEADNDPQHVQTLIPGTCEHVTFHAKGAFTGGMMLKDLRWVIMLGLQVGGRQRVRGEGTTEQRSEGCGAQG